MPDGLVVGRGPDLTLVDGVVREGGVDDLEAELSVGVRAQYRVTGKSWKSPVIS